MSCSHVNIYMSTLCLDVIYVEIIDINIYIYYRIIIHSIIYIYIYIFFKNSKLVFIKIINNVYNFKTKQTCIARYFYLVIYKE